jgi:hypothetical protein
MFLAQVEIMEATPEKEPEKKKGSLFGKKLFGIGGKDKKEEPEKLFERTAKTVR